MTKSLIFLMMLSISVFSQTDNYICHSSVKDTGFIKLVSKLNKKYAVIEVLSNNNDQQIGSNLRNIIIERIMALGNFEKVYVALPDSNRDECLILKTKVADFTCQDKSNAFAVGLMFGIIGSVAMLATPQGAIAVKTDVFDGKSDSLICSHGFYSKTNRGTSTGSVPYQSIVCIAEAITKYAISINSKQGETK